MTEQSDTDRFWGRVDRSGDCWAWTGAHHVEGYGEFQMDGRRLRAHRVAWEWAHGPIPVGLEPDHLCRNRACVNPDHLELVTHRVNILRGLAPTAINAAKTECPRGHPYVRVGPLLEPEARA